MDIPQVEIKLYDTLQRAKVPFKPINPGFVGLYVCGPTVYGHAHLGHARPYITFDVFIKFMKLLGYKVRYVRNITDVGHLQGDADHGEDKIAKKAKLEKLEPMEVVQTYTLSFHKDMERLNIAPPSIEPRASGHILEQIELTQKILDAGLAYVADGSVYFDVEAYRKDHHYGKLSGRVLEDLLSGSRDNLDGQEDKRGPFDFALWKKASPEHIMRWSSPWSDGFPGWHLECSAMSTKYLGTTFDIHGGGMDLMFPHHECEIAQNKAGLGHDPANYWMHCNMITINGQKMGKSLGNFINLNELFTGSHPILEQAYSPMTVRLFILQSHYRSTLDFSNEALQAAEKGFARLINAVKLVSGLKASSTSSVNVADISGKVYAAMNDDFNTPIALSHLFEAVRVINSVHDGKETLNATDKHALEQLMHQFVFDILGLKEEQTAGSDKMDGLMQMILQQRVDAKARKDYAASDLIRDKLKELGFEIKDGKEGTTYTISG